MPFPWRQEELQNVSLGTATQAKINITMDQMHYTTRNQFSSNKIMYLHY